jgi:hypothetical protein
MPTEVIDRVHVLARRNPLVPVGLVFGNRDGVPDPLDNDDEDEDDDLTYDPHDDESDNSIDSNKQ